MLSAQVSFCASLLNISYLPTKLIFSPKFSTSHITTTTMFYLTLADTILLFPFTLAVLLQEPFSILWFLTFLLIPALLTLIINACPAAVRALLLVYLPELRSSINTTGTPILEQPPAPMKQTTGHLTWQLLLNSSSTVMSIRFQCDCREAMTAALPGDQEYFSCFFCLPTEIYLLLLITACGFFGAWILFLLLGITK